MYAQLLLSAKLFDDLRRANSEAEHWLDTVFPQMAKAASLTETLKASEPMKWGGMMNTIKAQIEEILYFLLIQALRILINFYSMALPLSLYLRASSRAGKPNRE